MSTRQQLSALIMLEEEHIEAQSLITLQQTEGRYRNSLLLLDPGLQHVLPMRKGTVHRSAVALLLKLMAQLGVVGVAVAPSPAPPVLLGSALTVVVTWLGRHLVELHSHNVLHPGCLGVECCLVAG